ncbi:MAG: YggS family pyridoxal phosphate-dependent enzyme [Oscillospiraceae bacterium]|nr:YggS family pyridoxal phosphate-dependent enzyme [Oscillospiraceae bacterium]
MNEFDDIAENIKRIKDTVENARQRAGTDEVRIMAVTKTVPPEKVNFAISQDFTLLGENRVQEYLGKKDMYSPAEVHFIGHLQSNKIKYLIDSVTMIQSVDSVHLAREISKAAVGIGRRMDILCEVNIGREPSKTGFDPDGIDDAVHEILSLEGVRLRGLMAIPPVDDSIRYFDRMRTLYEDIRSFAQGIDTLSMGMSSDYPDAIACGSNLVRIGSALFGARLYNTVTAI